ncbi:phage tail protein [Rhizobium sp. Root149]|uniref:phage tail tape measure protein n=1 Tax=Rhizobium sp. Root149 TaxID=1736473 RepID=UPI0007151156|nr:phage tail tape measure protein [Rhizobium sp. Root149]KQZ63085.1 phage tail protein [Rhizobium sp. Root149]
MTDTVSTGRGLDDALSTSEALSRSMQDLQARSQSFGSALSSALQGAALNGKGLDTVLRGLGQRLSDIALAAALKPLENAMSGIAGSLLGSLGSGVAGKVTPFADGGVVRSPSFFSMGGNATGLMGEAGAEAILPLKRGADGALGVAMSGGSGGASGQIVFNVTATDAASFKRSEGQITAMLARSVARGRRGV